MVKQTIVFAKMLVRFIRPAHMSTISARAALVVCALVVAGRTSCLIVCASSCRQSFLSDVYEALLKTTVREVFEKHCGLFLQLVNVNKYTYH